MRTIQPTYVKVSGGAVNIQYGMLDLSVLSIMIMSELWIRTASLHIMPIFTPNEYMLTQHSDKGTEDWEIYAWCVRDAIAKAGNFKKVDRYDHKDAMTPPAGCANHVALLEVPGGVSGTGHSVSSVAVADFA